MDDSCILFGEGVIFSYFSTQAGYLIGWEREKYIYTYIHIYIYIQDVQCILGKKCNQYSEI